MPASSVGGNLIRWFHDPENGAPPTCSELMMTQLAQLLLASLLQVADTEPLHRLSEPQDYIFVMLKSCLDSQKGVMCRPDERPLQLWADLIKANLIFFAAFCEFASRGELCNY
jgi:hypothetical protein